MDDRRINTQRVIVGALTLSLVLVLLGIQVSTAPPALAASVSVSPGAGEPGSSATVSGTAFVPLVAVDLCWNGQGCSSLGSAIPDVSGGFSAGIGIPSGVAAGTYAIGACQALTGCAEASFEVLSRPDDSSTLPSTTSTSAPATTTSTAPTTTVSSTTTTRGPTTTLAGPTTTRPVPTTTVGNTPTTTSPGQAPPSTAGIVGPPGSSTTTSTPGVEAIAAGQPLADATSTPFALDIDALIAELFAPEPPIDLTPPEAEVSAAGLGVPLAATAVDDAEEEEDDDAGSSFLAAEESTGFFGFEIPRFGIWIIWLVVILGSTALVLTADEWRRRRAR